MRDEHGTVHSETDEARGGSTPRIVRWVLVISTLAAIVLLSIVWITGAVSQDEAEEEVTVSGRIGQAQDDGEDTDGIVMEDADEFAAETGPGVAEEADTPIRTIEN